MQIFNSFNEMANAASPQCVNTILEKIRGTDSESGSKATLTRRVERAVKEMAEVRDPSAREARG